MHFSVCAIISFSLILAISAVPIKDDNNTLVLLHVLFRHGNRAADFASLFPNDVNKNVTYEPFGYSQLTNKGKRTAFKIGKYLREKYNKFLPKQYTPNVLYALSTNFKRTKMTLQLVLAGLFPPMEKDKLENMNWQPIPFNIEQGQGLIGYPFIYCPIFVLNYMNYYFTEEAQKLLFPFKSLYQQLSKYTGRFIKTPKDVAHIYSTLKSEEDFGLKLPFWASTIYPKALEEATAVDYELSTATNTLKKLNPGFLLKKILEDTESKIQPQALTDDRKIYLYSAHDVNIAGMLRILNVFQRHVPPFGAFLIFEVHQIKGEYGLKIFYQDYKRMKPRLLKIPGCEEFCNLETFYKIVQNSLPGPKDLCTLTDELI